MAGMLSSNGGASGAVSPGRSRYSDRRLSLASAVSAASAGVDHALVRSGPVQALLYLI
eukprot:SAG22_NODE_14054_length_386_cov_0.794425_1_plen_57_part_10